MAINKTSFLSELSVEWRKQTTPQKFLYCLYLLLLVPNTLALFRAIENRVGLSSFTIISDAFFLIIPIIGCIGLVLKKVRLFDIFFLMSLVIIHFISEEVFVETAAISSENAPFFLLSCLPLFLIGLTIDQKTSLNIFVGIAYWALFIQIIFLFVLGYGVNEEGNEKDEMMWAAYNFLPFVCILLWNAFSRRSFFHTIIAFLAVLLLLSMGTRGPIVCVFFFIAIYLLVFKKFKYNISVKIIIVLLALLVYSFSLEISLFFSAISEDLGLSTRVYDNIIEGQLANIEESGGRDAIWESAFGKLTNNRIYWDFHLYVDRLYNGVYRQYVHNLELELLCDFGLIGGAIIIVLLFYFIFYSMRCSWRTNGLPLLFSLFTASVMQLQFSNSFLSLPVFWLFLGSCTAMIRGKKKIDSLVG